MTGINPYLTFNGETEAAFNFYKSVFGGEFAVMSRMGDAPRAEGSAEPSEGEKNKVMHVSLPVGGVMLMGSDVPESYAGTLSKGNNISISINSERKEEAEQVFNDLAEGGTVTMPLNDTFWGAYFGMLTDQFGINWMINYDYDQEK